MAASLVVIGTSLGGLSALRALLSGLPKRLAAPVAIVQHRGKEPDAGLDKLLQGDCVLPVREPEDKEEISAGHVYLGPADYHLLVDRGCFCLSTDAPVFGSRPSIDVLFESAAASYGKAVVAVVLTGASQDGAAGAAKIAAAGGLVIVQDPGSAESPVMPEAAVRSTPAARVLPLAEIARLLVASCAEGSEERP